MVSRGERAYGPASANQKRMYVLHQLSPGGTEYNVPVAVRLQGKLDVRRLRKALSTLVARHAGLRTSFAIAGEEVVQRIRAAARVPLPQRDASSKADVEAIRKSFVQPFDLRHAPLLRACLIRLESTDFVLLLDLHHIICDGVSVDILLDELGRLYDGQTLKTSRRSYEDFARWQKRFAKTAEAAKQEEYWLDLLSGDRPPLSLPTDYPRKRVQSFDGDRLFARPGTKLSAALRSLVAKNRVSMYMVLLAAYNILLSKYTGQEDVIVGTLVAGRGNEKFRDVVGLFVNTLLLRSQPKGELEFVEYLKLVRGECLSAFENQDYQFEELVDRISPPRDLGRNPLFDTMFGALAANDRVTSYGGVDFSRYELDYEISKFDLSLTAIEQQDHELVLEFEYCTELFRGETIERLSSHYLNVLADVVANPRVKLADISLLTPGERGSVVTAPKTEIAKNVVELFDDQVRNDPAAPAVTFGKESISYGELSRCADELAATLRKRGVARGDLVGVAATPSIDMIVAVLSVLRLGAAYLPIDPTTPMERFRSVVADSGIATLLIRRESRHFAAPGVTAILLDEALHKADAVAPPTRRRRRASPPVTVSSDDVAYVIYTSGSTGTPKGVVVSHGALANYVAWATRTYIGDERISFAFHSPLSVDLTVTSIFAPLVSGNRIVIYQNGDGIGLLREIVRDNQVEVIKLTPTHLTLLAEVVRDIDGDASRLRKIIVGGEELKTSLAATIHASFGGRVEIFNEYGPTEATVGCIAHQYQPGIDTAVSVPIGRAIDNTSAFILDQYRKPVPIGVTGELYLAGVCLANGYLNNPHLTDERFVAHRVGAARVRMYKTGDLARMLPDGSIDYLGRNDDQVKIRGFRVELGEIEANLLRLPHVKEAVVTKRLDAAGDSYLCAYVVLDGERSTADLRAALAEQLPPHMIPAWFVPLERLPVARGGKLDKHALPDPHELIVGARAYAAPRSKTEAAIARIWEQVLGLPRVGIDDNFFELGGQSLKATLMTVRVDRELQAGISLRDVFAHPVIRELAALAERTGEHSSPAIEPVAEQEHYPASSAQKRLYILHQLAPADVQYNVPWAIEIAGEFDAMRWERAFRALIARQESLRTSFALIDDEIVQKVHPRVDFAFAHPSSTDTASLRNEIERFVRPFDLGRAPLIRAAVIETGATAHTLIVDMHHIVSDGISVEIILEELLALYRGQTLETPDIEYKDYAVWQRSYANTEAVQAQGAYWTNVFKGEVPVLNLPTDFPRGAVQSFDGDLVRFHAGPEIVEGLRAINRDCGATMHMTLLAAYTILLSKYAGQDDVIVGTPVAGRNHASLQRVVGMFVNTLAMRNRPAGELTFHEFLRTVKSNALDAYSNQDYQFEELVDRLEIERNLSRNPLFDTVFALLDGGSRTFDVDGLHVELLDFDWKISKFDLSLLAAEREQGLDLELEYCTKLFRRSTIERLGVHYTHLLEQIARDPELKIANLEPLTETERHQIAVDFNQTQHLYAADRSIHELFEEQVAMRPGNVAVVSGEASLSYRELNGRANQVARRLVSGGVAREEVVGIIAGPSIEMIVGILAILKAGCAYLPIDRDCPDDRVRAILDDSGARMVVAAGGAGWRDELRLVLDLSDSGLYQGDDSNLDHVVAGRDLAYVIYTSGTTGVPKGVMIEHHSVNNLCAWHNERFNVTAADRATKYARFSFDASVWEIFPYLQAGAALYLIDEQIRLDMPRLNRYFEDNGITISFLPTQVCEWFMELPNESLRILLTGGDRLRRFRPKNYRVVNNYGPTENTVVTTSCDVVAEEERIPIGRPLFNTRVYLLDKADKLVPIGVPGELCIAGVGLARAYVNDPEQTARKFVANPFEPGTRMYRTGDLARWLPDGSIEYIGRTDKQVKIRGCRTEPREIEATILAHVAVKDAVVVAREDRENNKFLCAYVVWHDGAKSKELRAYLGKQLPDYMVPAFLIAVDAIPMNATGKVDTGQLPPPDGSLTIGRGYVAARTDTERRLVEIWCRVLDRERIGVHDHFFEIGGHSLRATIMLAKANKEFSADIALGVVFDHPTIAALARCFDAVTQHQTTALKPAEPRLRYPTTQTQKLLYLVCTAQKRVEYNLPMSFELRGELNVARLEGVFREMIRRHESLRTSFGMFDGELMQTVSSSVDFAIDILEQCDDAELPEVTRDFIRPFDLSMAPLMRVALIPMSSGRHVLLMDIHHLVSDGTSMGILFQEMAALYVGEELPLPAATFKDFTEWQAAHAQTEKVREQEQYWLRVLKDPPAALRLDTDYVRHGTFSFEGGRIDFQAGPALHAALKALCARYGVTLYMLLLAAYNVLLSKYTGQEDIIIAAPTSGRCIADVQDVVGMFVATHAVRSRPEARLRFDDFLRQVKTDVLGALEHQEYQLWDILVGHTIRTGGQSLFGTVFIVQDQAFKAIDIPGLDVEEFDPGYHVAKFDLTLGAVEKVGHIDLELEYSTDVYSRAMARRIARHYSNLLEQIVANPGGELRQFEVITRSEKEKILHEFNGGVVAHAVDGTIVQAFERQAQEFPDRVAVVCGGESIPYRDLNGRANRLARSLRRHGIDAGDRVGVMVSPGLEMVTAILGVWKAGAAYVPLSETFPPKRVERVLAESGAKLLLSDGNAGPVDFATPLVDLRDERNYDADGSDLAIAHDAGALAIVNYVADRTGELKGVMIEQRSLFDRCRWYTERFAVSPEDRSAKYGDLSASATIFEIFPFLCAGASIYILPEPIGSSPELLNDGLEQNDVTMAWLPAPLCERLGSAENRTLRVLLTFGRNVSAVRRGAYELVRCFGPVENSEVTTWSAIYGDARGAVIGKPITGAQVYILGHDDGLQPVGVTGELCVAGVGLARGYWGDAETTASRFTANPHVPGGRIHRTGASARWLPDGRLELTGRVGEVSVDGQRVSLAEIQRRLESHWSVQEAVVVFDDDDPLRQRLVAFLVMRGTLQMPPQSLVGELKSHLRQWLPESMVPDTYVQIGTIPREADGRVQYESLPVPERPGRSEKSKAPQSATAGRVASIVEEVLGVPRVDPEANLFDLGMTSLAAMNLVSRIDAAFGVCNTACQLFAAPTISGISHSLSEALCDNDRTLTLVGP